MKATAAACLCWLFTSTRSEWAKNERRRPVKRPEHLSDEAYVPVNKSTLEGSLAETEPELRSSNLRHVAAATAAGNNSNNEFWGNATVFIGIGSVNSDRSRRSAQRATWLRWVLEQPGMFSYRYFIIEVGGVARSRRAYPTVTEAEDDVEIIPTAAVALCTLANMQDHGDQRHHCRSGAIVEFMLRWALIHTSAAFVVTTEHDGFVCVGSLRRVLPVLTQRTWLAHWFFERDPYVPECHQQ